VRTLPRSSTSVAKVKFASLSAKAQHFGTSFGTDELAFGIEQLQGVPLLRGCGWR
jgi:hypothetical protein